MPRVIAQNDLTLPLHVDNSLLVTWQNPATRTYHLMGHLEQLQSGRYAFSYYPDVDKGEEFRPIPGFADLEKTYESAVLFPLFSSRLMSSRRPDRAEWLEGLGLPEDADPFTILGRSLGQRVGDTFELYPEPSVDLVARTITADLPVHGLRYQPDGLAAVSNGRIRVGDSLSIVAEPGNAHDPRAQAVWIRDGVQLGYVPGPVLDYFERGGYRVQGASAQVIHVNSQQYGLHQRLTLRIVWRV